MLKVALWGNCNKLGHQALNVSCAYLIIEQLKYHLVQKLYFVLKSKSYPLVKRGHISFSEWFRLNSHNRVWASGEHSKSDVRWRLRCAYMSQAEALPPAAHPQGQVSLEQRLFWPHVNLDTYCTKKLPILTWVCVAWIKLFYDAFGDVYSSPC